MQRQAELRRLLCTAGVARAEIDGPIVTRQGHQIPWTLYSLGATLASSDGMTLAAKELLHLVERFGPCQLAAHGLTAAPLLGACIALSGGRYSGLLVRTTVKDYGLRRYVEGRATPDLPVVIIDDSISAGTSFCRAARLLEHEGYTVAGTACLVEFPRRGGRERAEARGYRVETSFDVWRDLELPVPGYVPGHLRGETAPWSSEQVPPDLPPADAAVLVARHYLSHGRALLPPLRLALNIDARGGTYVSFREIDSDRRLARDGFWHFQAGDADPERDLVLATIKTVRSGRLKLSQLDGLKCAVSFFGPLRTAQVANLDYQRLGVVVRGKHWPKTGGALPNTQVFTSEAQQLRHARRTNAALNDFEPHDLYVHEIAKYVESGHSWPLFGTPATEAPAWIRDPRVGELALRAARETLHGEPSNGEPLSLSGFAGAGVSIYRSGIAGCSIAMGKDLQDCVRRATAAAARDRRFGGTENDSPNGGTKLVVSLLHHPEHWGTLTREGAERKLRLGRDTVWVHQGERQGVLLDSVPVHYNWDRKAFIGALLDKARLKTPPYDWTAYQTASWITSADGAARMDRGFVDRSDGGALGAAHVDLLAEHLAASIGQSGLPRYRLYAVSGATTSKGSLARHAHALHALLKASRQADNPRWRELALRGARVLLDGVDADGRLVLAGYGCGPMAHCALLNLALDVEDLDHEHAAARERLLVTVKSYRQSDGRIQPLPRLTSEADHDFLPGVALLGLLRVGRDGGGEWRPSLEWYRRRFRRLHPWGLAVWHAQAWSRFALETGTDEPAEFVHELVSWMLEHQLACDGSFVTDLYAEGPSFHTAFIAEAIAAAWELAEHLQQRERARRYADAWARAMTFSARLVVVKEDLFCIRDHAALGGVRATLDSTDLRIDYTSHTLVGLLNGLCVMTRTQTNHASGP